MHQEYKSKEKNNKLLVGNNKAKGQWNNTFKERKEKNCPSASIHLGKINFENKGETKTFSDSEK